MIFANKAFFLFLPVVLLTYHLLRSRTHKYRFLLAASWLFYCWFSAKFFWVILFTTGVDFAAGRLIESAPTECRRRAWLLMSLAANLGLLAFFKYTVFALDNAYGLARLCGFEVPEQTLRIALPLGISFHTFQGVSYTLDVYRRRIPAVRSFTDFALFVAFFPQLAAGPIVRAVEFLPQMVVPPTVTAKKVGDGLHFFVLGLCKKMFIADRLDQFVGPVFARPELYDPATHVWAALAWAAQIYCDFSGYSDMATGCAKWFGFDFPRNFDYPYLATSIGDFWRRWHMTLSTWLRDYLYFPMGGSRLGELRTHVNLTVVFVLCGLWHGAAWNWLAYGVYNGALMSLHRVWDRALAGRPWADGVRGSVLYQPVACAAAFLQVILGLVLIRMSSWEAGWRIQRSLLGLSAAGGDSWVPAWVPMLVALVAVGHLFSGLRGVPCGLLRLPSPVRAVAYVTAVVLLVAFGPGVGKTFIYIHF